jgi:hypothetical protein
MQFKDLTGKVFGHLKVIERAPNKRGATYWLCEEIETGIRKPVASTHLIRGNTKSFTQKPKGDAHGQWAGVGKISGNYWWGVRRHARDRKHSFDITIEDAWEKFQTQGGKCALSGLEIYLPSKHKAPFTASLDRIDSSKPYTSDNIQWVHKRINIMKNKFSEKEFIEFCKAVAQHNS